MRSRVPFFLWLRRVLAAALLPVISSVVLASPRVYPTGVTIYDPTRAYNCFVSFSSLDGSTHLIDMDGNEVHRWAHVGLPGEVIDPKLVGGKRGHVLLDLSEIDDARGGIFTNKTVGELDWEGNTVWEWGTQAPGGAARQNHDWQRLPNGNTLLMVTIPHAVKELGPKEIGDQGIYEVTPDGKLAWQWVAGESSEGVRVLGGGYALSAGAREAQSSGALWVSRDQRHASAGTEPLVR